MDQLPKTIRVEFEVNNSFYAQESPTVYISGGVVVNPSSSSDEYVGRIPKTAMLAAPAELAPMFVQPAFTSKLIGQSTDAFLSFNLLSITFSVNTPLARGSIFMISGLVGASAPSGTILLFEKSKDLFTNSSNLDSTDWTGRALWDDISKSIRLVSISDIAACAAVCSNPFIISFQVYNPPLAQDSPLVHIEVSGKIRIPTTPIERSFTGVMQVRKTFVCKVIGQSTHFPDTDNTITATLAMNVALLRSRTGSMSISGLVGAISDVGGLIELRACVCALQLEKLGV